MAERKAKQVEVSDDERAYPAIELFLEGRDRADIGPAFADTRAALEGLPKPKAEQGKRALHALNRTEELLGVLFDHKDRLVREAKAPKKGKR